MYVLTSALALAAGMGGGACAVAQHAVQSPSAVRHGPAPRADVAIVLRDGRVLHLAPLPFGALVATPVGPAQFDTSGTRALIVAQFTGAGIAGDWRTANPSFVYMIDAQRRVLTQLSTDGRAQRAQWSGATTVSIKAVSGVPYEVAVEAPAGGALPAARLSAGDDAPPGSVAVSPSSTDRFTVYRGPDGRYTIAQIGAARFRIAGVAHNGAYAVIGRYLAWIDGQRHIRAQIARSGPDLAHPLSFAGSPYGDALVPIRPLGTPVFQSAYRKGVAYFTFSYGVQRIVAASEDLVHFWFPALPHEPVFTVGDGFGIAPDGAMYFIRPEEDVMLFTRAGHYVRVQMSGLDAARDPRALTASMPSFDPTQDALHAALAQWRFYPVGDSSGNRWIVSHLGHLMIGDGAGGFAMRQPPAFPFAVLGRTDDGRLWGASPSSAAIPSSTLWSSRDGATWQRSAQLDGAIGAVGMHGGDIWIALTRAWFRRPMIWVAKLGSQTDNAAEPTGATYAGEQLAFADTASGFFVFVGATPGWRLDGQGGPLSAFRIDEAVLQSKDQRGDNPYAGQRLDPSSDPSLPAFENGMMGASAILEPSLACGQSSTGRTLTIASNAAPEGDAFAGVTVMSADQERAFELKYAAIPFPLATVKIAMDGDNAQVDRGCDLAPLHASGALEQWSKDPDGAWHLDRTTSRFRY